MTYTRMRTASKPHVCADCGRTIARGVEYLVHVCSPDDPEIGNKVWVRQAECQDCAQGWGRERDYFGRFWKAVA